MAAHLRPMLNRLAVAVNENLDGARDLVRQLRVAMQAILLRSANESVWFVAEGVAEYFYEARTFISKGLVRL
jgi:hypothetical protein